MILSKSDRDRIRQRAAAKKRGQYDKGKDARGKDQRQARAQEGAQRGARTERQDQPHHEGAAIKAGA